MSITVADAAIAAVLGPDLDSASIEGHTFDVHKIGVLPTGDRSFSVSASIKHKRSGDVDVQYFYDITVENGTVSDLKITKEEGSVWNLIEVAAPIVNRHTGNKLEPGEVDKLVTGFRDLIQSNVAPEIALVLISYIAKLVRIRAESNFEATKTYAITVVTAPGEDSGTDSNVYIKLYGPGGTAAVSSDKRLLASRAQDNFIAGTENYIEFDRIFLPVLSR